MKKYLNFSFTVSIIVLFFSSCTPETQSVDESQESEEVAVVAPPNYPNLLIQAFNAHGGLEQWQSMSTLDFAIDKDGQPEQHIVDLKSRKVIIEYGDQYRIGFNGKDVWVAPNKAAFGKGSARFYHNLRFYFVAMPFIVSDPGIKYEVLPQKNINGKNYDALSIKYNEGVGDAPDDEYILHFDPETHQMEWLLYTVTYYSGKPETKYNALHYNEWQEVDGLLLPQKMVGYKYENGQIGEKRYERAINILALAEVPPYPDFFEMPEVAEIDSLIQH